MNEQTVAELAAELTPELIRRVEAVRDGVIREPDEVRRALDEIRRIDAVLFKLLDDAEDAFVRGWPPVTT